MLEVRTETEKIFNFSEGRGWGREGKERRKESVGSRESEKGNKKRKVALGERVREEKKSGRSKVGMKAKEGGVTMAESRPVSGSAAMADVPKVLLIDNLGSFTYNVYQFLRELKADVTVWRSNEVTVAQCHAFQPTHVVVSPGPGHPTTDAGVSIEVIKSFAGTVPVFGICMGLQCIYEAFGGKVVVAGETVHGKVSSILHDGEGIFADLPQSIKVTRYHSLVCERDSLPGTLKVTAKTHSGLIMAVRHRTLAVEGVQFHPESILSQYGHEMLRTFLGYKRGVWAEIRMEKRVPASKTRSAVQRAIRMLCECEEPSPENIKEAFEETLAGNSTEAQTAALLMAIKLHGETPALVNAVVEALLDTAVPCLAKNVVDIVGTGGDGLDTFNVSTCAGIVAAGAGLKVAKHGNRSASSQCGSADVLEHLGAVINMPPSACANIIDKSGFCFLFAQAFHPAIKHVAGVRRQMGVRTIMNMIGPLINPTRPVAMVVGVYSPSIGRLMAETLQLRGLRQALVVCGAEGLDEISISGPTHIWRLDQGQISEGDITPDDFGLPTHPIEAVQGGPPERNAKDFIALLEGKEGPVMDFVLLNTAALLVVAGKARTFKDGVAVARESISSGRASRALSTYLEMSQKAAAGAEL